MIGGRVKKCVVCGREIKIGHMRKVCGPICNAKRKKMAGKVTVKSPSGRTIHVSKKNAKTRAWNAFSAYIRGRDKDKGCITCGSREGVMQAGHALSGRGGSILFDEEIVFKQCQTCNMFRGGMYSEYASILIHKHGIEWWDKKLQLKTQTHSYSIQDYLDIEAKYKLMLENIS
jgi:hypothetical protein